MTDDKMITYANKEDPGGQRFTQYSKDTIPSWAVDIQEIIEEDQEEYIEEPEIVCKLLADGSFFISHGKGASGEPCCTLCLNCSDVFAWGCADGEYFKFSEIPEIYKYYKENEIWGTTKWVCIKRNQQPQKPVADKMKAAGYWDEVMESLPNNKYDINVAKYMSTKNISPEV